MHTRNEMLSRVRAFVLDESVNTRQFSDAEIIDRMQKAANTLWNNIISHRRANQVLLKAQTPQRFITNNEIYKIPADSLRIDRIEFRSTTQKFAKLVCGAAGSSLPVFWAAITNGSIRLFADDALYDVRGIDFTGAASMPAVATIIQTAARAATGGEEEIAWVADHFEITCFNRVFFLDTVVTGLAGTDLSQSTHMNGRYGSTAALVIPPSVQSWQPMTFDAMRRYDYADGGLYRSTNASLFASPSHGAFLLRAFWRHTAEGFIELVQAPNVIDGIFRIWYYRRPAFPAAADDKFDTPEDTDTMVEYLGAGLLSLEELEDGRPIGTFGTLYANKLTEFLSGVGAGQITHQRRYVNIVQ